jgi:hypothetical protein
MSKNAGVDAGSGKGLHKSRFACRRGMNQIKIWKAKLDYLVVRQTHKHKSRFACRSGMNQIKIWEAKLDYLVVRQRHEQKCGSGWREREGSAQIQVCMPQRDESD